MSRHTVAEVAEKFEEYASQVAEQGEPLIVTRDGQPFVELRPAPRARTLGEFLDRVAELSAQLDPEEREAFARDIEAAHAELNALPLPRDPWES